MDPSPTPPPPPPPRPLPPTPKERAKNRTKPPKKRVNLSYSDKLKIVNMIEAGTTKVEAGKKFSINESTVRGIFANRQKIKDHFQDLPNVKEAEKALRSSNKLQRKTEHLLKQYIDKQARRNIAVDTRVAQDVALQIYKGVADKQGVSNPPPFNASRGWFNRFKHRYNIKSVAIAGEAGSADKVEADIYPETLKNIIEEGLYTPQQIWNMDETNFYWKSAPRKSFVVERAKSIRGRKPMKQRFTLLLACNAAGDKMKPTVVHTAKRPRSYAGMDMRNLNVHWLRSKKGYVSSHLSLEWLIHCFIKDLKVYCREKNIRFNILLLLDNAPGHSLLMREQDPDVRVEFLPPNTTSLIQPLDQEIISVLKASYAAKQFRRMRQAVQDDALIQALIDSDVEGMPEELEEEENLEYQGKVMRYWSGYSIKSAVDLLVECWREINKATINHGWEKILSAVAPDRRPAVEGVRVTAGEAVEAATQEANQVFNNVTPEDIEDMLEPPPLTADDVIHEADQEDEADVPDELSSPTSSTGLLTKEVKEILACGMKMKHLLEQDSSMNNDLHCANIASIISLYEEKYRSRVNTMQQKKITTFFTSPSSPAPAITSDSDPDEPMAVAGPSGIAPQSARSLNFDSSESGSEFEGFLDSIIVPPPSQRGGGSGENQ